MGNNKRERRAGAFLVTGLVAFALACTTALIGCGGHSEPAHRADTGADGAAETQASLDALTVDMQAMNFDFADREQNPSYDDTTSIHVTFSGDTASVDNEAAGVACEGAVVTVSTSGTYVLTGNSGAGQIVVDAQDADKVQLVLANLSLANESAPAIYVKNAAKTFVTLAEGTNNSVGDGASRGYVLEEGGGELDAVIFSHDDLAFNGNGSLVVTASYKDGIAGKDDVTFCNAGTYSVSAADDGIRGKDSVKIQGGTFTISTDGDGIKSTRDDAPDKGYVFVAGGALDIASGGKGIASQTVFRMDGGNVDADAEDEGIESEQIHVNGGVLDVVAVGDGINASARDTVKELLASGAVDGNGRQAGAGDPPADMVKPGGDGRGGDADEPGGKPGDIPGTTPQGQREPGTGGGAKGGEGSYVGCMIVFNGGDVTVASTVDGDGLDSNGSIAFNGGNIVIEGSPMGSEDAMDYEYDAEVNGGNVLLLGQTGMSKGFTSGSQAFISETVDGGAGGTMVLQMHDGSGDVLIGGEARNPFMNVIASCPEMSDGGEYELVFGKNVVTAIAKRA